MANMQYANMQIKISSAVADDFNQLISAVCAPVRNFRPALPCRFMALPCLALPCPVTKNNLPRPSLIFSRQGKGNFESAKIWQNNKRRPYSKR